MENFRFVNPSGRMAILNLLINNGVWKIPITRSLGLGDIYRSIATVLIDSTLHEDKILWKQVSLTSS